MKTHTFAELEVSRPTFNEIYELLAIAGYHHAFLNDDSMIDMKGIAIVIREETEKEKQLSEFASDLAKTVVRQILMQAK